jgi:uncharacterized protein YcfJ
MPVNGVSLAGASLGAAVGAVVGCSLGAADGLAPAAQAPTTMAAVAASTSRRGQRVSLRMLSS